jgi:polyribonucleotide nucleotidyltransferase
VTIDFIIPNQSIGGLIGKGGETLKKMMTKTKAQIIIPRAPDFPHPDRIIQIKGTREQVEAAKKEIEALVGFPLMKANPMFLPDPKRFPMCMPPFRRVINSI